MGSGQWAVGSGQLAVGSGQWTVHFGSRAFFISGHGFEPRGSCAKARQSATSLLLSASASLSVSICVYPWLNTRPRQSTIGLSVPSAHSAVNPHENGEPASDPSTIRSPHSSACSAYSAVEQPAYSASLRATTRSSEPASPRHAPRRSFLYFARLINSTPPRITTSPASSRQPSTSLPTNTPSNTATTGFT